MKFADIYGTHFELRLFDSIQKVGPSGIRSEKELYRSEKCYGQKSLI